jgi:GNAT superfamily N-acetyltransferase
MIIFKQVDESYFKMYDEIPMLVQVNTVFVPKVVNNGLGGILFNEINVEPYTWDISHYEVASDYAKDFDISNWAIFMAFNENKPVGGITAVSRTKEVRMLDNRDDLCVLWDLRVNDEYKGMGIGTKLFEMVVEWSKINNLKQIKIETQTNNVPACRFYAKQGAVLRFFNEYSEINNPDANEHEMQVIWYLDL